MHIAKKPLFRRLMAIDRELRAGSFPTAEQLAALTETHIRTTRRDIEYLRDTLLAPVEFCRQRRGWHYSRPTYQMPGIRLNEDQLTSLLIAKQALDATPGNPFAAQLDKLIAHFKAEFDDWAGPSAARISATHSTRHTSPLTQSLDRLDFISKSVADRAQLKIDYWTASTKTQTTRVIDPLHLANIDGQWYLVAYCHLRQAIRMFAPWRIESSRPTGETFDVPDDFSATEHLASAFRLMADEPGHVHRVILRFSGRIAHYIAERTWHPSQQIERRPSDELILTMELSSLVEVERWILSWGVDVDVIAPVTLRNQLARTARAIAAQYPLATPVDAESTSKVNSRRKTAAG